MRNHSFRQDLARFDCSHAEVKYDPSMGVNNHGYPSWVAWENSPRYFTTPPTTIFPAKWRKGNEPRNSILMTCHYPDLGVTSDWLKQILQKKQWPFLPIRRPYWINYGMPREHEHDPLYSLGIRNMVFHCIHLYFSWKRLYNVLFSHFNLFLGKLSEKMHWKARVNTKQMYRNVLMPIWPLYRWKGLLKREKHTVT